jgi:predicted transcriptional regulator
MKRLTRKEEDAMKILWKAKRGFVKDLIEFHPDPKPPYNTFSTIIRVLESKGFAGHEAFGKNHQYFPLVTKQEYRKSLMKWVVKDYFGSSYKDVVFFLIDEEKISMKELKEIVKSSDKGKKKK